MNNFISASTLGTALLLSLAATSASAQSLSSQHAEVVMAAGENAPGIVGKNVFSTSAFGFGTPVIDQEGTAFFRARLEPSGIDDYALYVGRGAGDMQLVAQSSTQAPGLPAGILLKSSSITSGSGLNANCMISPTNQFLFFSSSIYDDVNPANTPTTADSAMFWGPAAGLLLLAREGDPVPGLSGETFGALSMSRQYNKINSSGLVTLPVALGGATPANDGIVLTGLPGALTVVLREGDDAGLGGGETWAASSTTMSFLMILNEAGQIAMAPTLGGSATTANDKCLAVYTPGSGVTVIAREGEQAPGFAPGVNFTGSPGQGSSSFNNAGEMAFSWPLEDGGVSISTANDQCVFFGGVGGLTKAAQEGDSTGLPGGETFGAFNNTSINTNDNGTIVFFSSLRDAAGGTLPSTEDSAMFYGTPGNWTAIVREGSVIPEIPASVNGPWTCGSVTGSTSLNSSGQLLFNQSCNDGVATQTFFLVYDPIHGLLVEQDATAVYTTVLGTGTATSSTSYGGASSCGTGSPIWFNNNGDIVRRQSIDNGVQAAIVKNHSGILTGSPSTLAAATGGTHTWTVDAGPANSIDFYAIIGSATGTAGFTLPPLGPLTIPLTLDGYTDLTISSFNTPVFTNSLGVTDANGRATATFNLPAGVMPTGTYYHAVIGFDFGLMETFVSEPASVKVY
jgi:hypothetical protein